MNTSANNTEILSDNLDLYRADIRRIAVLSREKVERLVAQLHSGDDETAQQAHRQLIEANLRYVVSVAKHYAGLGIDLLDLIQEGNIALIFAILKYDPAKGRLTTYITYWIRRTLLILIARQASPLTLPSYKKEELQRLKRVQAQVAQQTQEVTLSDLVAHLRLSEQRIADLLTLQEEYSAVVSLDLPFGEVEDGNDLSDLVEDNSAYEPEQEVLQHLVHERIQELLHLLTAEERRVIMRRYGLDGYAPESQLAISKRKGVSHEAIRQTEKRALSKLAPLCADLKAYLEW